MLDTRLIFSHSRKNETSHMEKIELIERVQNSSADLDLTRSTFDFFMKTADCLFLGGPGRDTFRSLDYLTSCMTSNQLK